MATSIQVRWLASLVNPHTGKVRLASLRETHQFLLKQGLALVDKEPYGRGYHLFYFGDDILVRIKTAGEHPGKKHRAGQAHLSVSLCPSGSLEYKGEWMKFTARGGGHTTPRSPIEREVLAKETHFDFPVRVLSGAEILHVPSGTA